MPEDEWQKGYRFGREEMQREMLQEGYAKPPKGTNPWGTFIVRWNSTTQRYDWREQSAGVDRLLRRVER